MIAKCYSSSPEMSVVANATLAQNNAILERIAHSDLVVTLEASSQKETARFRGPYFNQTVRLD
jgi:hypothetical protein